MIVKITKDEREPLEKVCAIFDLKCMVYTMESNELLLQAEITHQCGSELSPSTAWHLCAMTRTKLSITNV